MPINIYFYVNFSAKLFIKLFVVMGGTSIVDFLTWTYDKIHKPWPVVVLEVLNYFTPVVLFFLFCLNEKVIIQLWEKYPRFIGNITIAKLIINWTGIFKNLLCNFLTI